MVEQFTTIENQEPEDRSPLNPVAIILVALLLAALAWWIFAGQNTQNTQTNQTPITTNSSTPSGTQP
jgi:cytoskeletal protein RodZ